MNTRSRGRVVLRGASAVVLLLGAAHGAFAQPGRRPSYLAAGEPRISVSLSAGYRATASEFDERLSFSVYQEPGTTDVTYPVDAGVLFDGGGAVRIWRGLGAGIAVSRFVHDGTAATTSSLPHPLLLSRNRTLAGEAAGISREETAVHVLVQYALRLTPRLQLTVMGGPSRIGVTQTLVREVNYSEAYPYDEVQFTGVDADAVDGSAVGFHAGVDVSWMLTRTFGIGGLVRLSGATVDLDVPGRRALPVDAGGAHAGAGVRLRF